MATTLNWLASPFPQLPQDKGYTESGHETAIHADRDLGPPQSRRRALEGMKSMSVTYECTQAQVDAFDAWWMADAPSGIAGGSLSFNILHPRGTGSIEAKILAPPRYRCHGGDDWSISMILTQLQVP